MDYSIDIKKIPIQIKLKFLHYFNKKLDIVGYKMVKHRYKVPIIELPDYTRIWIFQQEINTNKKIK
uniref:Cytochrome b6-f complex subunit PetP n=1 Tax=Dasya naccarioides TaxID=2007180 RepID=A0A1Z1MGL0_9FLOR|nr:cytochrome b6-f complex subunit PetP [Dasya naccarioides]ARW65208.1 cytochrome b6-f complex subunit PetP [Dasya naccarioides]